MLEPRKQKKLTAQAAASILPTGFCCGLMAVS
jgi:hypothetical protein